MQETKDVDGDPSSNGWRDGVGDLQGLVAPLAAEDVAETEALDERCFPHRQGAIEPRVHRQRSMTGDDRAREIGIKPAVGDRAVPRHDS